MTCCTWLPDMIFVGIETPISEKPIDWSKVNIGDRFTAKINGSQTKGVVEMDPSGCFRLSHVCGGITYKVLVNSRGKITNLKIQPMAKTKKVAKKDPTETIVRQYKSSNGSTWNIIRSIVSEPFGERKAKEYYVQLLSGNGNKLTVGRGLNTCQSARKNMNAVIAATKGIREVKLKK